MGSRAGEGSLGGAQRARLVESPAVEHGFGLARPPRLCSDATERYPRLVDDAIGEVEGDKCLREVAGIGGDTLIADPEHGMLTVDSIERRAAASRLALVTCTPGWV